MKMKQRRCLSECRAMHNPFTGIECSAKNNACIRDNCENIFKFRMPKKFLRIDAWNQMYDKIVPIHEVTEGKFIHSTERE